MSILLIDDEDEAIRMMDEECLGVSAMSGGNSGKDRKPYTLTKQRERWSHVEHAKFEDALKLFHRDWKKIEEHVQTKTIVQVRRAHSVATRPGRGRLGSNQHLQ